MGSMVAESMSGTRKPSSRWAGSIPGRAAEGVGLDDVRARRIVGRVDLADHIGPREDEVLVAAFEVGAPKVLRAQVALLDHRPHRAVDHEDLVREELEELLRPGGERREGLAHLGFFPLATMTWNGSPR